MEDDTNFVHLHQLQILNHNRITNRSSLWSTNPVYLWKTQRSDVIAMEENWLGKGKQCTSQVNLRS